ncbi:hypothetical protein ACIRON_24875 [Nocardioides sp. NPDC101246]|uniref:hypothetical protein n=1 Tax=Nocardioides sp. NPDC101246 TaxID=3364336 RepID=UPI003819758E
MTEDQDSVAFDPKRPFTRAWAAAQGNISDLRTAAYKRLLHGVYVAATVEVTPLLIAEAVLMPFGEKAWASHATAARADLERREAIDDDQWRIMVFVAKDIYKSPGRTLERIHRVLRLRGEPGVPAVLSDAWRAHFPGWS